MTESMNKNTEIYRRTDLACESPTDISNMSGVEYENEQRDGFEITKITIKDRDAARKIGRPCGTYVTVSGRSVVSINDEEARALTEILRTELSKMAEKLTNKKNDRDFKILLVGLGNSSITADAVGPLVSEKITVTRHMKDYDERLFDLMRCCEVSSIRPGVLGQTGIESAAIVRSAALAVKADAVVAVDALVAGSVERLASTIQISDTGIEPGSGIGNVRTSISKETVNVPVISVGVPTVVSSSTLVWDALCLAHADISCLEKNLKTVLDNGRSFFVSPKESDIVSERMSDIIADAFEGAFGVGSVLD